MSMAPTPAQLAGRPKPGQVRVTDTTPAQVAAFRRVMRGIWWEYHKRQLNLLQMVCASDRQWEVVRDQSLDLINEGEKAFARALGVVFAPQSQDAAPAAGKE